MTGLCEKGAKLLWEQCNEELYSQGLTYLQEAAYAGDPEAWFFLGRCYSWGDGTVGFNEKKAYDCYRKGAEGGSARAVLGAVRAGQYDGEMKKAAVLTLEESYQAVRDAAEAGDAFAAWQLAEALEGETLFSVLPEEERGKSRCLVWYEKAAEAGIVPAMVKMGKCFLNGQYTDKDLSRYIEWADRAAACGNVWGLYRMGLYHEERENDDAAFQYFQAAFRQGDAKAPLRLGRMYLSGQGTARDVAKAVECFKESASRGEMESYTELGNIFYRDEIVERDDEKAFYWYSKAYAAGHEEAALPLARLYLRHSEIQDYQKAEKLLKEAAEADTDGQACLALGNFSRDGLGGAPDMDSAVSWYEKGAEMGNPECMELLGCLYFQGEEGIETDYEKAFFWLNRCYEMGTLQSYSKLAYLYLKGEGCEADEEKARDFFERAAQTEYDGYAFYELGFLCERKNESPEDLERAAEYYQKAIEMGNESAVRRFSHFKKGLFGKWKVTY